MAGQPIGTKVVGWASLTVPQCRTGKPACYLNPHFGCRPPFGITHGIRVSHRANFQLSFRGPTAIAVSKQSFNFVLILSGTFGIRAPTAMRMILRTEEWLRRAAECTEKELCAADREIGMRFAELAEQWRMLAEHTGYLGQYN
jgi:hypothetical protein